MKSRIAICVAAALIAGSAPLFAQVSKVDRQVDFVRNLAKKLRFISLAQSEVENLMREHKQSEDFKSVSQLGVEIALIGARSHPNREERRTLFKDCLEKSEALITRYDGEEVADKARMTLVEACFEYGRFLLEEIELARDEAPDQVKDLEENAGKVYQAGVDACTAAMLKLSPFADQDGTQQQRDHNLIWYYKGILQRENARAIRKDRGPLSEMARETFEELIFEVGEETILGMRGFFEMSKINLVLEDYESASGEFIDVVDSTYGLLTSDEIVLNDAQSRAIFHLLQEAYDQAAQALFQAGKIDEVLALIKNFRAHLKEFGEKDASEFEVAHPVFGHPVFLTEARAMAESGDPELVQKALTQVRLINDKHPNDFIGIKAKSVLKDILAVQSGNVPGALLYEVAKGEYQAQNHEIAIKGFKRAYAAMTEAEHQQYGLELWGQMGKAFGANKRYLEATIALKRGLDSYGKKDDVSSQLLADVLSTASGNYTRTTKRDDDNAVTMFMNGVNKTLEKFATAADAQKKLYMDATRAFQAKDYKKAAETYARITPESQYYETTQSRIAACWRAAGEHGKSRASIAAYFKWLETPAANIPSNDKAKKVNRERTIAALKYYGLSMTYREVMSKKDATQFKSVLTEFDSWIQAYGKQASNNKPFAFDATARLHAELGNLAKAEEKYRMLKTEFPGHATVAALATRIFKAHNDNVKALEVEQKSLFEKDPNDSKLKGVEDKLNTARKAALASGLAYVRNSSAPKYGSMWTSLLHAKSLKEWNTVEELGTKILDVHGKTASLKTKIDKYVKVALGEAYMQKQNFRQAEQLLREAVDANPNGLYAAKRLLALTLGGWVEFDESSNRRIVPGLDRADEAYEIYYKQYRKKALQGVEEYTLPWYRFHWEAFMFASRAKGKDSKYGKYAKTLYNKAEALEEFDTVKNKLGKPGREIYDLFQSIK